MPEQVTGRRFSHIYINAGVPVKDSEKARFRLSKLAEDTFPHSKYNGRSHTPNFKSGAVQRIERELGIKFASKSTQGTFYEVWEWFFRRIPITEMLDTITVLVDELNSSYGRKVEDFILSARRIFKEENLAYEIDDEGGVHPLIDGAFSANKQASIMALSEPRYKATATCVEAIDGFLLEEPPDYKGAIRAIFGANENLFKLIYNLPRLDGRGAGDKIGKDQQALYDSHPVLQAVGVKTLDAFKSWINAAHFYRHEEGVEEPNQPSEEVAILLISQGLSYVRWLAQIDRLKRQ